MNSVIGTHPRFLFYPMNAFVASPSARGCASSLLIVSLSLVLSGAGMGTARAEFINAVAIAFASNGEDTAINLIDDNQLSFPLSPESTHDVSAANWTTVGSTKAEVVFDLGENTDLTRIYIWNFQGDTTQSMKDVEIQVSPDPDYATARFTAVSRFVLQEGGENAQPFDLVATNVRLVKVKGLSNYGHGFQVNLAAVRFESGNIAGSVPEVSLVSPREGDTAPLGEDLVITAEVTDDDNDIAKVEFFDGTASLGSVTAIPYSLTVTGGLTFGEHEIRATATDQTGKSGWSTALILVRESVGGRIIQIDDEADIGEGINQITYSEGWTLAPGNANDPRFQQNDHYSFTQGSWFEVRFSGTKIDVYATVASHHGLATASLDGGAEFDIDYQADQRGEQKLVWSSPELPNREHVLRITVKGSAVVTADRFDIHVPTTRIVQIDDEADIGEGINQITYSEGWTLAPGNANDPRFQQNDHYSFTQGSWFEVRFVGVKIDVYATVASHHGLATASLDGGAEFDIDYQADQRGEQKLVWSSPELPNREHVLRVTVKGSAVVTADRFDIHVADTTDELAAMSNVLINRERLEITFSDFGASIVDTASLELLVDGQEVVAEISKTGETTLITHRPSGGFAPGSQHQFEIRGADTLGNAIGSEGSLSVPAPPFPLAGLGGPRGTAGNWGLRQIWDAGLVNGLAGAVELAGRANAPGFTGEIHDTQVPVLDFGESSNAAPGGFFPDDLPFPAEAEGLSANDFVVIASGFVQFPAGDWTIGVHGNEGFAMRVRGAEFSSVAGAGIADDDYPEYMFNANNTLDSNSRGVISNLTAGTYQIEYIGWERTGEAYFEVYAAPGVWVDDFETGDWVLIGADGGLELVEGPTQAPDITGISRTGDVLVITFGSAGDPSTHRLEESTDLTTWSAVTGATIEIVNNAYRASVTGLSSPARFFRVALP
jgi:hypothetical protein